MGWSSCTSRGENPSDWTREFKKEKILLKKIFDFDWNTGSNASITIQESFMLHTLNDFGVQINPQTTHIIFWEFNKFMFLNLMMKTEAEADENDKIFYKFIDKIEEPQRKAFTGLVAPLIIDLLWKFLLQTSIYWDFCFHVFGAFVDRATSKKANSNSSIMYERTIKFLTKYSEILYPFHNFWPKYSYEQLELDAENCFYLTSTQIKAAKDHISSEIQNKGSSLTDQMLMDIVKATRDFSEIKPLEFEESKEAATQFSELDVSFSGKVKSPKSQHVFINTLIYGKLRELEEIIIKKYLIKGSSTRLIDEYVKFLMILGIDEELFVPSSKVELVWTAHYEISKSARDAIAPIFDGKIIFPNWHIRNEEQFKSKYEATLAKYTELFREAPDQNFWESPDDRIALFKVLNPNEEYKIPNDGFEHRHPFNLYRFGVTQAAIQNCQDTFNSSKMDVKLSNQYDEAIRATQAIATKRASYMNQNLLFQWRSNFPKCKNVYSSKLLENEVDYLPYPYDENETETVFTKGGVAFLKDPFQHSQITNRYMDYQLYEGFYEHAKANYPKELDSDDISDAAISKIDLSRVYADAKVTEYIEAVQEEPAKEVQVQKQTPEQITVNDS